MNRDALIHLEVDDSVDDEVEHLAWVVQIDDGCQVDGTRIVLAA